MKNIYGILTKVQELALTSEFSGKGESKGSIRWFREAGAIRTHTCSSGEGDGDKTSETFPERICYLRSAIHYKCSQREREVWYCQCRERKWARGLKTEVLESGRRWGGRKRRPLYLIREGWWCTVGRADGSMHSSDHGQEIQRSANHCFIFHGGANHGYQHHESYNMYVVNIVIYIIYHCKDSIKRC